MDRWFRDLLSLMIVQEMHFGHTTHPKGKRPCGIQEDSQVLEIVLE
jgi:hypothetical protein